MFEREGKPWRNAEKNHTVAMNSMMDSFLRRSKDESSISDKNKAKYEFGDYHSYDKIMTWLNDIEHFYPNMAKVFTIGTTFEKRFIKGIKLISRYGIDPQITSYIDTLNFYIVPVVNPDGYEYSRSDRTPRTRFWRKNRGKIVCFKDSWHRKRCCTGVDLNRNFDFHWGEIGSSSDVCSEVYHGSRPFSEPETRAIRDKLLSAEMSGKVDAFITLHTYSQMWIHPYSHKRHSFPNDINPSSGGSDDWAKSKAGVKFVYLLELRPGEHDFDGFLLDRRQLIPTGRETWAGIRIVIDAIIRSQRAVAPGITLLNLDANSKWPTIKNSSQTVVLFSTPHFLSRNRFDEITTTRTTTSLLQSSVITPLSQSLFQSSGMNRNQQLESLHRKSGNIRQRCSDTSPWCTSWIRISPDICRLAAVYMRQRCTFSCGLC
uniref:ShKT domain-containing protein n=1 Tax=Setaria digitata TaxID=48799 RepID=A0A915Q010_9BILA